MTQCGNAAIRPESPRQAAYPVAKGTGLATLILTFEASPCYLSEQLQARRSHHMPEDRVDRRLAAIFGDGVNVAARLEALADPGGIMVSGIVHDQVRDKLSFSFEDMGEQAVKNIVRPVGVHRVQLAEQVAADKSATAASKKERTGSDRPSLAVLPFANMSGDAEQEYFADGIT